MIQYSGKENRTQEKGDKKMAQMRLDKLLSSTGRWSRREVKQLVREGRVLADGRPAVAADDKYDPEHTVLQVDGERLSFS